jgi:DNA-binding NarL/FixJ family response regulator
MVANSDSMLGLVNEQAGTTEKSTKQIRVLLVDDHEVVRRGLRMVLADESDMTVVDESDGKEQNFLFKQIETTKPDVILMDIRLDGMDGFELSAQIKQSHPEIKIIMLTGYESELYASEALFHRTNGFITKESSKDFICTAIRMVELGGSVWQGDILFHAIRSYIRTDPASNKKATTNNHLSVDNIKNRLTAREIQVLVALGQGINNKDICRQFNLPDFTVKKIIHGVFTKIGVSNRTQAALFAQRLGLE